MVLVTIDQLTLPHNQLDRQEPINQDITPQKHIPQQRKDKKNVKKFGFLKKKYLYL